MIKSLTLFILIPFFNSTNEKVILFKTPILKSNLSHFTPRKAQFSYRERGTFTSYSAKISGERVGSSEEHIQWRQGGACSSEDQSTWLRTTVSGVRIPPRPHKKGEDFLDKKINQDRANGSKAMELSYRYFLEMKQCGLISFLK